MRSVSAGKSPSMETGAGEGTESFPLPGYIVCPDTALQGLRTRPAGEKRCSPKLKAGKQRFLWNWAGQTDLWAGLCLLFVIKFCWNTAMPIQSVVSVTAFALRWQSLAVAPGPCGP